MRTLLSSAGELVRLESELDWAGRRMSEGLGDALRGPEAIAERTPTMTVLVEAKSEPFDVRGWTALGRSAWERNGSVVVTDITTSGFDCRLRVDDMPTFTFRRRPPARERAAAIALPSRARLLRRSALVLYPVLWAAGVQGRVPLHACASTAGDEVVLLSGPSGVGKSTLVAREIGAGGRATSDNLCVSDGASVWGVAEPARLPGASGRRSSHGRRETPLTGWVAEMVPDRVVLLAKSDAPAIARPCEPSRATRALAAGTYMAGELRRFWPIAATWSLGTGRGPVHPAVW